MVRYIQVSREEFNSAETGDRVFGKWLKKVIVSVRLGEEVEHRPSRQDDPNTEYRVFVGCRVSYYLTATKALSEQPSAIDPTVTVLLFQ
jgi:hypothetical protein